MKNTDKHRAYHREWNKRHPAITLRAVKKYQKKLHEQVAMYLQTISCVCCGAKTRLSFDHVVPKLGSKKTNTIAKVWIAFQRSPMNFQILCRTCNSSKGD